MKKLITLLSVLLLAALCLLPALANGNETEIIGDFVPIGIGEPVPTPSPTASMSNIPPATGVPAARPVSCAASGVTRPQICVV